MTVTRVTRDENDKDYSVRLADIQLRHNGIKTDPKSPGFSFQGSLMGLKSETSLLIACIQCPLCERWVSWTRLITDIDNWLNCGFIVRMCNHDTFKTLSPWFRKGPLDCEEGDYGHAKTCRLFREPNGGYGDVGVDKIEIEEFTSIPPCCTEEKPA